jgi:hypothetical protein
MPPVRPHSGAADTGSAQGLQVLRTSGLGCHRASKHALCAGQIAAALHRQPEIVENARMAWRAGKRRFESLDRRGDISLLKRSIAQMK